MSSRYRKQWVTNLHRAYLDSHTPTEVLEYVFRKGYMFRFYDVERFLTGPPAPTDTYSREELEARGLVGVYGYRRIRPL